MGGNCLQPGGKGFVFSRAACRSMREILPLAAPEKDDNLQSGQKPRADPPGRWVCMEDHSRRITSRRITWAGKSCGSFLIGSKSKQDAHWRPAFAEVSYFTEFSYASIIFFTIWPPTLPACFRGQVAVIALLQVNANLVGSFHLKRSRASLA